MSETKSEVFKPCIEQIAPAPFMRDIPVSPIRIIGEPSQIIGGYPKFRICGNVLFYGKQRFTKWAWGRLDKLPKFMRKQGRFARESWDPSNEWAIISYWDPEEHELIESHLCRCGGTLLYDQMGFYCSICGLMRAEVNFDFEHLRHSKTMSPATWGGKRR